MLAGLVLPGALLWAASASADTPTTPLPDPAAATTPVVVTPTDPAPAPPVDTTPVATPAPTTTTTAPPVVPTTTDTTPTTPTPTIQLGPPAATIAPPAHHPKKPSTSPAPSTTKPKHKSKPASGDLTTASPLTSTALSTLLLSSFRIPPFLLPIYQAAGIEYGIQWQVLAAINEVETDYGRNLNVSSAGAVGWMQFEPSTWLKYGVDANGDGVKDPYNPVDAIFAAARYLKAAGGQTNIRRAVFAYNHADWYVNSVLLRARLISAEPDQLISALTGLTQGRPPVPTPYTVQNLQPKIGVNIQAPPGAAAIAVQDGTVTRIGTSARLGNFIQLVDVYGNTYTYGHLGTVARFYPVPKPEKVTQAEVDRELHLTPTDDPAPTEPATSDTPVAVSASTIAHKVLVAARDEARRLPRAANPALDIGSSAIVTATPRVTLRADAAAMHAGAADVTASSPTTTTPPVQLPADTPATTATTPTATTTTPAPTTTTPAPSEHVGSSHFAPRATSAPPVALAGEGTSGAIASATPPIPLRGSSNVDVVSSLPGIGIGTPVLLESDSKDRAAGAKLLGLDQSQITFKPLREGATVISGTVLGRVGARSLRFEVRPAGRSSKRIDPAPLISGWRALQTTAILKTPAAARAAGLTTDSTAIGQVLLMGKRQLESTVLTDPRIQIYACGRRDIETGQIDRRVLAVLEYLADSNLFPTVSALKCGHSLYTESGNISEHSTGDAVDIAAINGTPILGNQGPGTITDITIRRLLQLQGVMKPHQIISLMTFPGADNTLALPDHYNHIHIGYHPAGDTTLPSGGSGVVGDATQAQLTPSQWSRLMTRLGQIGNPKVPTGASAYAVPDGD